jgi:hypothetical protein
MKKEKFNIKVRRNPKSFIRFDGTEEGVKKVIEYMEKYTPQQLTVSYVIPTYGEEFHKYEIYLKEKDITLRAGDCLHPFKCEDEFLYSYIEKKVVPSWLRGKAMKKLDDSINYYEVKEFCLVYFDPIYRSYRKKDFKKEWIIKK